jgi:histone-arginine methyltransferase CARM1
MLMDEIRTSTYKNAIINNSIDFNGKIVMDVGAGSGILSIFAAMAGA